MLNHAGSDKHKSRLKLCRLTMILAGCWPLPLTTQPSASWWMSSRRRVLIISKRAVEVQDSKKNPTDPNLPQLEAQWKIGWILTSGEATAPGLGAETPRGWSAKAQQQERLQPGGGCHGHAANPWHRGHSWRGSGIPGPLAQIDITTERFWERFEWCECTARNHRPPMIPNVSVRTSTLGSGSMAPIPCRLQNFLPPRCSQMLPKAVRHGQSFDSVRFRVASHVTSSSDITLNW